MFRKNKCLNSGHWGTVKKQLEPKMKESSNRNDEGQDVPMEDLIQSLKTSLKKIKTNFSIVNLLFDEFKNLKTNQKCPLQICRKHFPLHNSNAGM